MKRFEPSAGRAENAQKGENVKRAHVYLKVAGPMLTELDAHRLVLLYRAAEQHGVDPETAQIVRERDEELLDEEKLFPDWRQDLRDGKIDAVVLWHQDLNRPDIITREDVSHGNPVTEDSQPE